MSGMFVNGMWSTEQLTWWQRFKLRGRMKLPSRKVASWIFATGLISGALVGAILVSWAWPPSQLSPYLDRLAVTFAVITIWMSTSLCPVWLPSIRKVFYNQLIEQGRLFPADHALMRMLWPAVQGVWRANPSAREQIGGLINEFAKVWHEQESKHGRDWYILVDAECRIAWDALNTTDEGGVLVQLGKLCPPAANLRGKISDCYVVDARRHLELVTGYIADCERTITSLNQQRNDQALVLKNFVFQRAYLLIYTN